MLISGAGRRARPLLDVAAIPSDICKLHRVSHSSVSVGADARASVAGTAARPTEIRRTPGIAL